MAAEFNSLTSVPMSDVLAASLARAAEYARAVGAPEVTSEHLLMSLTDDPDASEILSASQIDIHRVQQDMAAAMAQASQGGESAVSDVLSISDDLRRILEAAGAAASGGRRRDIDGAIVLAAIVGDEKTIAAARLRDQGLTFEAAIKALKGMLSQTAPGRTGQGRPVGNHSARAEDVLAGARERVLSRAAPGLAAIPRPATPTMIAAPAAEAAGPSAFVPPDGSAMPLQPVAAAAAPRPALPPPVPPPIPVASPRPAPMRPEPAIAHGDWGGPQLSAPPAPFMPVQNAAAAAPAPVPQPARRPAPQRRGPKTFDLTQFLDPIPRLMRSDVPTAVEIRVPKSELDTIAESMGAAALGGGEQSPVLRALTVRIRAPEGGLHVEPQSPDTQWIENRLDLMSDDFASWRWQVTPRRRGKAKLEVIVSARNISADGSVTEIGILDQPVLVKINLNARRTALKIAGIGAATALGWVLARLEAPLLAVAQSFISRFSGG